jgi:plastocyanin domain-containing protein
MVRSVTPSLGLPLDQPVVVEFTPVKTGEFKFAGGMDRLRSKIIVR